MFTILEIQRPTDWDNVVTVSDGTFVLTFDTHDKLEVGSEIDGIIDAWDIDNLYKSDLHEFHIGFNEMNQKQYLNGQVIDASKHLVLVGKYKIEVFGEFPGDIMTGDFVEFDVGHFNFYL